VLRKVGSPGRGVWGAWESGRRVFLSLIGVFQPQLPRYPGDGAGQLLPPRLRRPADFTGDVRPFLPQGAQIRQPPLLVRQPPLERPPHLPALGNLAGAGRAGLDIDRIEAGRTAVVAALRPLAAGGVDDLVAGHADEQADEVLGTIEVVLTQSGAEEE